MLGRSAARGRVVEVELGFASRTVRRRPGFVRIRAAQCGQTTFRITGYEWPLPAWTPLDSSAGGRAATGGLAASSRVSA